MTVASPITPPPTLAIDTTSAWLSLAVGRGGQAVASFHEQVGVKATSRFFAETDAVLRAADLTVRDIGLIVVAVGPGSFTGTRIGMAAAATLAQVLTRPLIGVDSLSVLAARTVSARSERFHALLNCARDEVYHAPFRWDGPHLIREAPIAIATFADLPGSVGSEPVVARRFQPEATEGAEVLNALPRVECSPERPDAERLLELGWARYRDNPDGPFPVPEPIYLKSEAFRKWKR